MEKILWSPKIRPARIWQLYQNDARGTVDELLVEEVGFSLYHRCRSIWLVTRRQVECPRCGAVFKLRENGIWKLQPGSQPCPSPGCGWETTANNGMNPGNTVTCWVPPHSPPWKRTCTIIRRRGQQPRRCS